MTCKGEIALGTVTLGQGRIRVLILAMALSNLISPLEREIHIRAIHGLTKFKKMAEVELCRKQNSKVKGQASNVQAREGI
jgi:hypothetical protein